MHKVSVLAFPLRADIARLRRFVDSYLNFVDDECPPPFYFQPTGPYVLLELLHYPYLAVTTRNLISYPQHEMQFIIPLECYAIEDGAMVFKQFAVCSPFIYLEEELSIVSGRTIFGLPKIALKFDPVRIQDDPRTASQMAQLQLRVATQYGDSYVPFIEIFRDPARFVSARNTQRDLVRAFPDAVGGYLTSVANTWETLTRSPLAGYDPVVDSQSMFGRARATFESFLAGTPVFPFFHPARPVGESTADFPLGPLYSDVISLKQARDAEYRDCVSYQSLVRSTMYIDRLNDFGSLSSPGTNDTSGGITIKIHNIATQPVIESLGLEVIQDTIVTEGSGQPNQRVLTLRPEFPYWMNLDLTYGLGTNLYSRWRDSEWSSSDDPGPPRKTCNRYLTFGGGASQEDSSRLISPHGRVFILALPLVENGTKLEALCGNYLKNDKYDFKLHVIRTKKSELPNYVWMVIRNLTNTAEGKGPELEQEVEFCALVEWSEKGNTGQPPVVSLVPISIFSDTQTAVITESEVLGRPTIMSKMEYQSGDWTKPYVDVKKTPSLLCVKALLPPELYLGLAPEYREIVRIVKEPECPPKSDDECPEPDPSNKGIDDLDELPKLLIQIPSVSLKQVIDCRTPEAVDYQAIVMRVLDIQTMQTQASAHEAPDYEAAAIETTVAELIFRAATELCQCNFKIDIFRYNSVPLVETMGLQVSYRRPEAGTTVDVIVPALATSLDISVFERGAINFASREGTSRWSYLDDPLGALERISPGIKDIINLVPGVLDALGAKLP
jgi:hypothetical protein